MNSRCHVTGKVAFETKGAAQESMRAIKAGYDFKRYNGSTWKRTKHRQGKPAQKRAYLCEHCDHWHLTSWETSKKIN